MKKFVSIVLIFMVLLFVSCGPSTESSQPSDSVGESGTSTTGTVPPTDDITVVKPPLKADAIVYLDVEKGEDNVYVVSFHVENPTSSTFEYTSNNGCVVDWKVYELALDSMIPVYPTEPIQCTQQIVIVQVEPGEDKIIAQEVFDIFNKPGEYLIEGSMGPYRAQQIIEVK